MRATALGIATIVLVVLAAGGCRSGASPFPAGEPSTPLVAIQPLGPIRAGVVDSVKRAITTRYAVDVVVLPERPLPDAAYYEPRRRYRATKLIEFLDETAEARFTKVVGITATDISVTKGEIPDWGIFGLGSIGGRPCVVSTHRLKHGGVSNAVFVERLAKITNHEVGHTFGLNHCANEGCLMEDAGGTIATIDRESGDMCPSCRVWPWRGSNS